MFKFQTWTLAVVLGLLGTACADQRGGSGLNPFSSSITGEWFSTRNRLVVQSSGDAYLEGMGHRLGAKWSKTDDGGFSFQMTDGNVLLGHLENRTLVIHFVNGVATFYRDDSEKGHLIKATWLGSMGREQESMTLLRETAAGGSAEAKNSFAWECATSYSKDFCGCDEAETNALAAVESSPLDGAFLDTLAAAYACQKKWALAVETQQKAVARLPSIAEARRAEVQQHLDDYLAEARAAGVAIRREPLSWK